MEDPEEGAANIMKQYAIVAADVEYNKNHDKHLKDVTAAIKEVNLKIDGALVAGKDIPSFYVIAWHLYVIRDDITQRLQNLK